MHCYSASRSQRWTTVAVGVFIVALLAEAEPTRAEGSELAQPLCETLRSVLHRVGNSPRPGARGLFIAATSEAFEHDPARLMLVQGQIDAVTSVSCPTERDEMLGVLKMQTLAQAIR